MAFIYSLLLQLLNPAAMAVVLMGLAALRRRPGTRRLLLILAAAVLLGGGNGYVSDAILRPLERRHPVLGPEARGDAIVVLSGGVASRWPPRTTAEVGEAGDRVLYGAHLFRQGRAPTFICTGGVATGGIAPRPAAEDMAEILELAGVPRSAVLLESEAENTRDHAVNLCPTFQERGIRRVLLVTSAMHMPRSVATFRRLCPAVVVVPAPTDFRAPDELPRAWYHRISEFIPAPGRYVAISEAVHEYLGMAYYRVRGWS